MLQSVRTYEEPGSLVSLEFPRVISSSSSDNSFNLLFYLNSEEKRENPIMRYQPIRSNLCYLWSSSRYDSLPDMRISFASSLFAISCAYVPARTDNNFGDFEKLNIPTTGGIYRIYIKVSRILKYYCISKVSYASLRSYIL